MQESDDDNRRLCIKVDNVVLPLLIVQNVLTSVEVKR